MAKKQEAAEEKSTGQKNSKTKIKIKPKRKAHNNDEAEEPEATIVPSSSTESQNEVVEESSEEAENGIVGEQKEKGKRQEKKNGKKKVKNKGKMKIEKEEENEEKSGTTTLYKFPMNRVSRIIKSEDSDLRISQEAVFLVNRASV